MKNLQLNINVILDKGDDREELEDPPDQGMQNLSSSS